MTPKKKDSPELFEVFRNAVRDREEGGAEDLDAVSSAERESLVAEAPDVAPREEAPSPAEPGPPSGMGERRLSLKYNTVVLGLMSVVGLVFISFAMGVRWGEDRAAQRKPATASTDDSRRLAEQLRTLDQGPQQPTPEPATAAFDPSYAAADPQPSTQAQGTSQPVPQAPAQPVGKYWVRLIDFDATDASAEALVSTHLRKLAEKGYQGSDRLLKKPGGTKVRAVCYGPFQTRAQASEVLPKLQTVNSRAYKQADVIDE